MKLDLPETAKLLRPNGAASIIRRHDISVRIDRLRIRCFYPGFSASKSGRASAGEFMTVVASYVYRDGQRVR
ncbi:hypothetical protein, partial [uncultured Brevundimonas sp.]|uniref:hypothetical protein n=1 Tax=uncultured Brevundimonas sp. TaxID=213418 RepID=UPI0025D472AA